MRQVNFISSALGAKRLDLLHELVPDLALVAVLVNSRFPPSAIEVDDLQNAASAMGLQALVVNATSERDFQTAFETFVLKQANALVVGGDIYSDRQTRLLVAKAARYGIPTIYSLREFAEAGTENYYQYAFRQMGVYTGRILKRGKAGGSTRRAADEFRAGDQCQGREDTWSNGVPEAARHRRRGD